MQARGLAGEFVAALLAGIIRPGGVNSAACEIA
jgi:hypothetical protein